MAKLYMACPLNRTESPPISLLHPALAEAINHREPHFRLLITISKSSLQWLPVKTVTFLLGWGLELVMHMFGLGYSFTVMYMYLNIFWI